MRVWGLVVLVGCGPEALGDREVLPWVVEGPCVGRAVHTVSSSLDWEADYAARLDGQLLAILVWDYTDVPDGMESIRFRARPTRREDYVYDDHGRVIEYGYDVDADGVVELRAEYWWNPDDSLDTEVWWYGEGRHSTRTLTYADEQLILDETEFSDGTSEHWAHTYDDRGRLATSTYGNPRLRFIDTRSYAESSSGLDHTSRRTYRDKLKIDLVERTYDARDNLLSERKTDAIRGRSTTTWEWQDGQPIRQTITNGGLVETRHFWYTVHGLPSAQTNEARNLETGALSRWYEGRWQWDCNQ